MATVTNIMDRNDLKASGKKCCYTPCKQSLGVYRKRPVRLSVHPENFNLTHNFWTIINRDSALILHMCIPYGKTFLLVSKFLTPWHWPQCLTYFWKTLTLVITFHLEEIWLWYYTCVFLVRKPFCWYQIFFTLWPWPKCLTYFWKT